MTFCLNDAVSGHVNNRRAIERAKPEDIADHSEPSGDRGSCVLADDGPASTVESALLHFQGERYALHAWAVMPNHVHCVISPFEGFPLSAILHTWKSFTAHQINRILRRTGPFWQEECFDHAIRNAEAFERFVSYTEDNPVVAGLCRTPAEWPYGSARFRQ